MPYSKVYTNIFLVLCVVSVSCVIFFGKAQSNSFRLNTSGDLESTNFYNVLNLSNGDKLAVGKARSEANMISVRFDINGNVLWKKVFGVYESKSILTYAKATENSDGSLTINGICSNSTNNIDHNICVELTLRSDGKLLRTDIISLN